MLALIIVILSLSCAFQALHAPRLLMSAIWLAAVSVCTSLILFMLGGHEIAILELMVGAGLITVLLVYAINMAGEESVQAPTVVPRVLAVVLSLLIALIVVLIQFPDTSLLTKPDEDFASFMWQQRQADLILQVFLIFSGIMGVMGLLEGNQPRQKKSMRELIDDVHDGQTVTDLGAQEEDAIAREYRL